MTNADSVTGEPVAVAVRWPGDETLDEPGAAYIAAADVACTVRVLRNFDKYRWGQIIHTDLVTAAGWIESRLAKLLDEPVGFTVRDNPAVVQEEAEDGGTPIADTRKPRARASRRHGGNGRSDDRNDAGHTEPVEGADPGRHGDSAG